MNRRIGAYTEVDCLFDVRRAILSLMVTDNMADKGDKLRKVEGDALWDIHFAKNYKERRLDLFEYPALGINREKFQARYDQRTVSDWLFMYPTNLRDRIVKAILEQEQLVDRPINISGIDLYVNTFPYAFDEEMLANLQAYCNTAFKGFVKVKLVNYDSKQMTTLFYKQFNYVFKYDLLMSERYKAFMDSLAVTPIPETCMIVPDLLIEETSELCGPIADRIQAVLMMIAPAVKLISIDHSFYDYAEA